jgi:hypothetical protein
MIYLLVMRLSSAKRIAGLRLKQLLAFPLNAIGWIKSKQKYSEGNDFSEDAKGTGFLIAPSLVLTSSHNFVIRNEGNGEVIEYVPISFSTL